MELFSRYKIQARVYPGVLSVLPVAALSILFAPIGKFGLLASGIAATGLLFLAANIVRSRGLKLEEKLLKDWGGFPTTRLLRHRDSAEDVDFERRRSKLGQVYGRTLPGNRDEEKDPVWTDKVYVAATRSLISRVASQEERFPRVLDENITYGFRRNMLGIRAFSIGLIVAALIVDLAVALLGSVSAELLVAVSIHLALLTVWLFVVTRAWVREAAERYASRLFEALDLLDPPTLDKDMGD